MPDLLDTGAEAEEVGADQPGNEEPAVSEEGSEGTNDTSTGAEADEGSDADQGGGEEADDESSEEGGEVEGEESGEEGGGRQPHQKTEAERIQELNDKAKKAEERAEKLEREFQEFKQEREAEAKPFKEVDMDKIRARISELRSEEDALIASGKGYEAEEKRDEIEAIKKAVRENDAKREEWEKQQNSKTEEQKSVEKATQDFNSAAEFFREQKGIDQEVWKKAGETLVEMMNGDKLLEAKIVELVKSGRPAAAVDYAYTEVTRKMEADAKAAEEATRKKEGGKGKQVGGPQGDGSANAGPKSYDEWLNMKPAERTEWRNKNPKAYKKLHEKATRLPT